MAAIRKFRMPKVCVQQQVGAIDIKHCLLDQVLRLAIKRMLGISVDDPLHEIRTKRTMTSKLRELSEVLINADTNDRLSKAERAEVLELPRQSKRLRDTRNDLPHCTRGAKKGPGEPIMLGDDGKKKAMPMPPLKEPKQVAADIDGNRDRLKQLTKNALQT
jgi:hypothetical protein